MSDSEGQGERRRSSLTDDDLHRIGEAFDKRQSAFFETIGYDVSTPSARQEIRKDHEFVRDARRAKGTILTTMLASAGTGIAILLWSGWKAIAK